ncbi:Antiseptic resistance protein [Pelagimonas phthalicica]|uniref:Antiseptic resistance protein n=1 Tax=Pelagimonas phthalicica TaxID=1037362 RepID=A0A238JD73_9RHOB|nr:MFS transporter [Pelagimonas phthalicica]TDS93567.1 putative MFS family arabinose efflux permease [Pelagimonas phthalicica]SMX27912.1 Antiseptic resistance protein [Pelagimonas phthalicica]
MPHQGTNLVSTGARRWGAVWALLLAAFVAMLDVTMVNLALPNIAQDFAISGSQAQWVLLAYLIPLAAFLLPMGRFGDALGRRRLFCVGVAAFAMGACLAACSPTSAILVAARTLQGIGAACLMPQILALINVTLPPDQRRRAFGYFGMISAMGAIAGPVFGGVFLELDLFGLGWRFVFLPSIPACAVAFLVALLCLDKDEFVRKHTMDVWQGALSICAIAGVVFAVAQGRVLGWPIWLLAMILISLGLISYMLVCQARGRSPRLMPLIPRELLRSKVFCFSAAMVLLTFSGIAGVPFLLAITLQQGPQFSPGSVASTLVVHPLFATLGAYLAGRFTPKTPWKLPLLGSLAVCTGVALLVILFQAFQDEIRTLHLVFPLSLVGVGIGVSNVALMSTAMSEVAGADAGAASGVLQTSQQIGISLSIAIVGGLYFGHAQSPTMLSAAIALLFPSLVFAGASLLFGAAQRWYSLKTNGGVAGKMAAEENR